MNKVTKIQLRMEPYTAKVLQELRPILNNLIENLTEWNIEEFEAFKEVVLEIAYSPKPKEEIHSTTTHNQFYFNIPYFYPNNKIETIHIQLKKSPTHPKTIILIVRVMHNFQYLNKKSQLPDTLFQSVGFIRTK